MKKCRIPLKGWRCTRYAGHTGPCAAVRSIDPFIIFVIIAAIIVIAAVVWFFVNMPYGGATAPWL